MNRSLQSLVAIPVVLIIGFGAWTLIVSTEEEPPTAPPRDLGPVPVSVRTIRTRELLFEVEAFGNLAPSRRVALVSETAGRIVEVLDRWRPGTPVQEGELLVRIDPELFELEVRSAEARLAESSAAIETARVAVRRAERSETKGRQTLAVLDREYERMVALEGVASETTRDRALRAKLDAEQRLETASSDREAAAAAEVSARAREETARASLAYASAMLLRTEVRAPFSGQLRGRAPGLGTLAGPGVVLAELVDTHRMVLDLHVPERDLMLLREGLVARLIFPSTPETDDGPDYVGRVAGVDAESDPNTRRGLVQIELENPVAESPSRPLRLPAGLFARASIEVERLHASLWIDRRHFRWVAGKPVAYVLTYRAGNREIPVAERRELILLREHGEGFLLGGGLAAGELLIEHPLDRLEDGVAVRPPAPRSASADSDGADG